MNKLISKRFSLITLGFLFLIIIFIGCWYLFSRFSADQTVTGLAINQKPLLDATGDIYGYEELTERVDGQHNTQVGPVTELVEFNSKEGVFIQDSEHSADAVGVVIILKGDSELKHREKKIKEGKKEGEVDNEVLSRRNEIKSQHKKVKDMLEKDLGKKIVANSSFKPEKDKMRVVDHEKAVNAISILDISVNEAKHKLSKYEEIESIEPNVKIEPLLDQSVSMIKANDLWPYLSQGNNLDGTGTTIGIVDTGVDYTHPDLGGCLGENCKVLGGYDFFSNDADPMDDHGHGTHVAATAAGLGSYTDSLGSHPLPGVAPGASIYAFKVLGPNGGTAEAVIRGIEACADPNQDGNYEDRVDVCSLSLGGDGNPDDAKSLAVDNVSSLGVVFTIAAGNSGPSESTVMSPGTARSAITVAAACEPGSTNARCTNGPIASFSSRGPVKWTDSLGVTQTLMKPDVSAPGVDICAAQWKTWKSEAACKDDAHISISGTSMATPHVAGVAALLKQAFPNLTASQVKDVMKSTAVSLNQPETAQGNGLVDAFGALSQLGLPNNGLSIKGGPLYFSVVPTTQINTLSKKLTLENTTDKTVSFTPQLSSLSPGISGTFDKQNFTILPRQSVDLTVDLKVDNSLTTSPSIITGQLQLINSEQVISMNIKINVENRVTLSKQSLFLGIDVPSSTNWTGSDNIDITNMMGDQADEYSVIPNINIPGVTASVNPGSFLLNPLEKRNVVLNVDVQNSNIPNGRYNFTLTFKGSHQTIVIPVTFVKGYVITLRFQDTLPSQVNLGLSNNTARNIVLYPKTSSVTIILEKPGIYDLFAVWISGPSTRSLVLKPDLPVDSNNAPEISLSESEAANVLTFKPTDEKGVNNNKSASQMDYGFERSNGKMFKYSTVSVSSTDAISTDFFQWRVNNIENSEYEFKLQASFSLNDSFYSYTFRANNITSSRDLVPEPTKMVKKQLQNYQNYDISTQTVIDIVHGDDTSMLSEDGQELLQFGPMPAVSSVIGTGLGLTASQGSVKNLYTYTNSPIDISGLVYPKFESIAFNVRKNSYTERVIYSMSPYYNISQNGSYSLVFSKSMWDKVRIGEFYPYLNADMPPGNYIPINGGPVFNSVQWEIWGGNIDMLEAQKNGGDVNISGSYSNDRFGGDWTIKKDSVLVNSGTQSTALSMFYLSPRTPGRYEVGFNKTPRINGIDTKTSATYTFNIIDTVTNEANPIDAHAPSIKAMHLISNNLWQNIIDNSKSNKIDFRIDPGRGFKSKIEGSRFVRMEDALTVATLEQSIDGINFSNVQLSTLGGGQYSGNIITNSKATLYSFRLSAKDLAGNTMVQTFQIPTGTAFSAPASDSQIPTVSIVSPTSGQTVGGSVPVTINVSDNVGVIKTELYVNNRLFTQSSNSPFNMNWDSTGYESATLFVIAYDAAGNFGASNSVTVNVESPDTIKPTTSITFPTINSIVSNVITVESSAMDNVSIARVELNVDGNAIANKTTSPYSFIWDTKTSTNGLHTLTTKAYDSAGNFSISLGVPVNVQNSNDTTPPTITLNSPVDGTLVNKNSNVSITASATDNVKVTKVEFYINNTLKSTDTSLPFSYVFKATGKSGTSYTIMVKAYDAAGNSSSSKATIRIK